MLPDGFIFIQRDWLSSNSLLLINDESAVLIDTGYATHADMTLSVLDRYLQEQDLDAIFNTHLHSDHFGGNAKLQHRFPNAVTHIPASQLQTVLDWDVTNLSYEMTGQHCPPFRADVGIQSGSELRLINLDWQVLESPGHDNDSLIFFQPDHRILVSADALWENGVSVSFPEFEEGNGFERTAETFDLIEQLNPSLVIPGHGSMFTDVNKALTLSRHKLNLFKSDPSFHALYSAKVLLKFKLMELKQVQQTDFEQWCLKSTLLIKIHECFFKRENINSWIKSLLDDFHRKNFTRLKDEWIINL